MPKKFSFTHTDKEFSPSDLPIRHILFSIVSVFIVFSIIAISAISNNIALAQPSHIDNSLNYTNTNNDTNNTLYVSGTAVDKAR